MNVVVDMCLPPELAELLNNAGHQAQHWSAIGNIMALDSEIMEWSAENRHVVLTHDLDFGDLLFMSRKKAPSVVIIRERDTTAKVLILPVLNVFEQFSPELKEGALISMSSRMVRIRLLPLEQKDQL